MKSVHTTGKHSQPGANAASNALAMVTNNNSNGATSSSSATSGAVSPKHARKSSGQSQRRQLSREQRELNAAMKGMKLKAKQDKQLEKATSKKIDAMLHEQMMAEKKVVKILLLGPGESGQKHEANEAEKRRVPVTSAD